MLIPAGRPLIATLTFPDNPCTPVIVTLSGVLPPCAKDTAVGLAAIVKSPEGVGSLLVAGLCVLVQLASVSSAMSRKTKLASRFGAVMKKFLLRHREDRALSAFPFGPAHAHAGYFSARPGHHLAVRRLPIPLHAAARPGFDFLASLHHWLPGTADDSPAYFFTVLFTDGVRVEAQIASHRPNPLLFPCRKPQREPASVSSPELSGASKSGVSVTSNAFSVAGPTLSTFTCVAHARSVGVGVGVTAEVSVQLAVLSATMSIDPDTATPPPSPGFAVAVATVNENIPFGVIGQAQHSVNS